MATKQLQHVFVDAFPEVINDGILYIAMEFATMSHRCACGCGQEVVTPLSPKDWKMTYDGETITLSPSVGNWSLPCKSHYLIRNGRIVWAESWDEEKILAGRERDLQSKRGGHVSEIAANVLVLREDFREQAEKPQITTLPVESKKPKLSFRRLLWWLE